MKVFLVFLLLTSFSNFPTLNSLYDKKLENEVSILANATCRIILKNFMTSTTVVLINKGNEELVNRILIDLGDFISVLFHPDGHEDFATHFILIGSSVEDIRYAFIFNIFWISFS